MSAFGQRAARSLGIALVASVVLLGLRKALAYVEVKGSSMEPALIQGDRRLAFRVPPAVVPRGGFVVGRMPRGASPQALAASVGHLRDQYVDGRQFVKVLAAKPGDLVETASGEPLRLGERHYWVEPLDETAAGSRQWGPVHGRLIWGWVPRWGGDGEGP